jgi:hypothetical protein
MVGEADMNSAQQHTQNQLKDLRNRPSMDGGRVREIARHVAVEVLNEFAQELKDQLAEGANLTPQFIDDAVKAINPYS